MKKYLLILVGLAVLLLLWRSNPSVQKAAENTPAQGATVDTTPVKPIIVDSGVPKVVVDTDDRESQPTVTENALPHLLSGTSHLIIPVAGIQASQLADTYTAARSAGRTHDAIDIMASHNAHVLAVAPGRVKRLFFSQYGGKTIYQLSPDGKTVYYYAHLDHYAEGIAEGKQVQQGEVIGYVGDTGNAGAGNYHLHFAIWKIQDSSKFWDGENVNPYPLLKDAK